MSSSALPPCSFDQSGLERKASRASKENGKASVYPGALKIHVCIFMYSFRSILMFLKVKIFFLLHFFFFLVIVIANRSQLNETMLVCFKKQYVILTHGGIAACKEQVT